MKISMITAMFLLGVTIINAENGGITEKSLEEAQPTQYVLSEIGIQGSESGSNTYYGSEAGASATGSYNSFFGEYSGSNSTGSNNTFIGNRSAYSNTSGANNTCVGYACGNVTTTGSYNTFLGYVSGRSNSSGEGNVYIGSYSGSSGVRSNTLMIENSDDVTTPLIYGEFDTDLVRVNGTLEIPWAGNDENPNHNIIALSGDNQGSGGSDVGFSLENKASDIAWTFRTYDPSKGFAISKIGTGGNEFKIDNPGANVATTVVKFAGTTVFENGHLVTASSRELKTDIKPLDTQAALDAFDKLQPVSYAYKAHKDEAVVGFIAEDVPELVAMPSGKSIDSTEIVAVLTSVLAETRAEAKAKDKEIAALESKAKLMEARQIAQDAKIAKLETMQKKVAMMESILTNLALDTSNTSKEKVSMK